MTFIIQFNTVLSLNDRDKLLWKTLHEFVKKIIIETSRMIDETKK